MRGKDRDGGGTLTVRTHDLGEVECRHLVARRGERTID
jgi:hypothetical protein